MYKRATGIGILAAVFVLAPGPGAAEASEDTLGEVERNEAAAIGWLRILVVSNERYKARHRNRAFALSLEALVDSGYLRREYKSTRSGYRIHYRSDGKSWSARLYPIYPGESGKRYFWGDDTGVIRESSSADVGRDSPPAERG